MKSEILTADSTPEPTARPDENEKVFETVWPQSKWGRTVIPLAPRVDTMNGHTIAELSTTFGGDKVYATLEKLLMEQFPGIKKFIPAAEFRDVELTDLGDAIKESGATLAITGCGC